MRATVSSLVIGGVPQLGPGYAGGFSLGAILGGIGRVGGALLGIPIPPRATGPNAITPPIRGGGAGGLRFPGQVDPRAQRMLNRMSDADFTDVVSGASTTAPLRGRRRRRLNPLNLRALGRADRRLEAFAKIARRYVSPNAPQRVVRTKRRKR